MPVTDEKPLNVQVAEALGCKPSLVAKDVWQCNCPLMGHASPYPGEYLWRYDTDWSATGPLIEKYLLRIWYSPNLDGSEPWWAALRGTTYPCRGGETPLIAVCHLILALKEAGKL